MKVHRTLGIWISIILIGISCSRESEDSRSAYGKQRKAVGSIHKTDSMNVKARLAYAQSLARGAQRYRAVEEYSSIIREDSTCVEAYLGMVMPLADLGRLAEAKAACQRAIVLDSTSAAAYNNLAMLYGQEAQTSVVLDLLNRALEVDPSYVLAYQNRGLTHYTMGNYRKAASDLKYALTMDPTRVTIYQDLGMVYMGLLEYEKAIEAFRRALTKGVRSSSIYYHLGKAYNALGQKEEAIASYERAVEMDPDLPEPHYGLAMLWRQQGHIARADSELARFQALLGHVDKSPDITKKMEGLRDRISRRPDDLSAHFDLGRLLVETGDMEQALREFNKVLSIDPKHVEAMDKIGYIYVLQKRYDLALPMYQQAIQVSQGYLPAYLHAGNCCFALGRPEDGMRYYRSAIEIGPHYAVAWYNLGIGFMRMKRWAEADSVLSRGAALAGKDPGIRAKFDRALQELREGAD